MLRPQDVLLACKLFSLNGRDWTLNGMAEDLGFSVGGIYNCLDRTNQSQLTVSIKGQDIIVSKKHLFETLAFAVPRVFYAVRGGLETGMPTGLHVGDLREKFIFIEGSIPLIWPGEIGDVKGESLQPIYPTVPKVAQRDKVLYELLALADIVRVGDPKNKKLAISVLEKRILGDSSR